MTPEQFAYWLHGWSEINGGMPPTSGQWVIINDHLSLLFDKVTPDRYPALSGVPPYVTASEAIPAPGTTVAKSTTACGYFA